MAMGSTPPLRSAETNTRLPRDFDIFSPCSATMPACTYALAYGTSPVATCACEAPISWCGNTRSEPPPWTSKAMPRCSRAMATHSTCQPGRPGPSGLGHEGSPSRAARHSSGSRGSSCRAGRGRRRVRGQLEHLVGGVAGHAAEARVGGDREVDVAVDIVCRALVPQVHDQRDDAVDGFDDADVVVRRQYAQGRHVLAEERGLTLRKLGPVLAVAGRALQQRVVDVGDVLHVMDPVARVAPGPLEEVERDVGRGVPHVGGVIRRDAADVEPGDGPRVGRDEVAGGAVEHAQGRALTWQDGQFGCGPGIHAYERNGT